MLFVCLAFECRHSTRAIKKAAQLSGLAILVGDEGFEPPTPWV